MRFKGYLWLKQSKTHKKRDLNSKAVVRYPLAPKKEAGILNLTFFSLVFKASSLILR